MSNNSLVYREMKFKKWQIRQKWTFEWVVIDHRGHFMKFLDTFEECVQFLKERGW